MEKEQVEISPQDQNGQLEDKLKMNFYEARDFLMTQLDPGLALQDMLKKGEINEQMVFALKKEMRRLGHTV